MVTLNWRYLNQSGKLFNYVCSVATDDGNRNSGIATFRKWYKMSETAMPDLSCYIRLEDLLRDEEETQSDRNVTIKREAKKFIKITCEQRRFFKVNAND